MLRLIFKLMIVLFVAFAVIWQAEAKYAVYFVDVDTGEVTHAVNENTRNYPASLTKIMTLYMLFSALEDGKVKLHDRIKFSKRAAGQAPSKLGLKAGESLKVEHAILALVTKSANDVATAVGEHLSGTETAFARDMTARARKMGMTRTSFRNASGLPNRGQLSTAKDMALLGMRIQQDFPQYYHYFSYKRFKFKGRSYKNHNNLLGKYKGVDGIKTGYIRASGFNLVASVKRDGHHLIGVVFGGRTSKIRDAHMKKLLNKSFALLKKSNKTQFANAAKNMKLEDFPRPPTIETQIKLASFKKPLPLSMAQGDIGQDEGLLTHSTKAGNLYSSLSGIDFNHMQGISAPMGDWVVQVGAYNDQARALNAANNAKSKLNNNFQVFHGHSAVYKPNSSKYFRAMLIGLTETNARQTCKLLKRKKVDCFPKQANLNSRG